ncbi:hypothetical protein CPB84DRAFT_1764320 [Gymnopilus junonius]|uniref:Major facilitator superfamily (MFS) profile domain-containing protein n=1 Tax=Gymnopilus junonius TaxID=109634 RepID=A0A9P5NZM9_GYMJU|nr:hypothetical protein CPB84DRAFT_1764320 [Gymnopilus junonius]
MAPTGNEGYWSIVDFIHQGPWWKNRGILILNLCLLTPLMTSVVNGIDSSLVNGLQILPGWQSYFHFPKGRTLGLINSAQFLGNLTGLPFTAFLSDTLGRRTALFIGSLLMCLGVGLQAAAWNVAMLIGARYTIGVGLSFCQNASPLLLIELSYPTHRGKITSLFNSSWYLGSIISAWVCFGAFIGAGDSQWSWRVPTLVQGNMSLSKGRESKAAAVLTKFHANGGDSHDPLVAFEMAQIRHAIRMEEDINRSTSFLSLFSTPGNRKRMMLVMSIAVFSQWSGNGLVSYYINIILEGVGVHDVKTKSIINGCLQIFNFVIAMGAAMLVDRAGRRPLFILSNSGMLATFCAWTVTTALYNTIHNAAAARATIPMIFLFYFFYDLAYTPLLVAYTLEILPFRIRAKGFAIMNLTVMATLAFNEFVNPWALDAISWWYYVVYCGWLILELFFVVFFIVETKGRTLEETAALFDGDDQQQDIAVMGGQAADMTSRLSRGAVLPETLPELERETRPISDSEEKVNEYYEMKKRYRDSDNTGSSSNTHSHWRAI